MKINPVEVLNLRISKIIMKTCQGTVFIVYVNGSLDIENYLECVHCVIIISIVIK